MEAVRLHNSSVIIDIGAYETAQRISGVRAIIVMG
jgi:hypothetical protein